MKCVPSLWAKEYGIQLNQRIPWKSALVFFLNGEYECLINETNEIKNKVSKGDREGRSCDDELHQVFDLDNNKKVKISKGITICR